VAIASLHDLYKKYVTTEKQDQIDVIIFGMAAAEAFRPDLKSATKKIK